jgi:sulfate transport system substrate-binding protein
MRSVRRRFRVVAAAVGLALAGTSLAACTSSAGSKNTVTLALVAYSTPQAAYTQIIKAFEATPDGKDVRFTTSYGASGDQSRAVAAGQKADIVAFSASPDVDRLVKAGLVSADWSANQYKGMVTDSVVVIATRKGNPKHIATWQDLIRPGISVISPNPISSGGARWNIMAAYGAISDKGTDPQAGVSYLQQLIPHIAVQDTSARASLQTFVSGKGDAMIAYENDALFAQQQGQPLDFTIPDQTILIENPVAVTSDSKHPTQAAAFLKFLYSPAAQKIYDANGYRPIVQGSYKRSFPTPSGLFTINDLGGWTDVTTKFFDATNGIVTKIEVANGVPITATTSTAKP